MGDAGISGDVYSITEKTLKRSADVYIKSFFVIIKVSKWQVERGGVEFVFILKRTRGF